MRERNIEKHLVKRVKELGGECRKVRWIGRAGAPDRVVMLPAGGGDLVGDTIWVELKATGKTPTAAQRREHTRMWRAGQEVYVFNSIEGIDAWYESRR